MVLAVFRLPIDSERQLPCEDLPIDPSAIVALEEGGFANPTHPLGAPRELCDLLNPHKEQPLTDAQQQGGEEEQGGDEEEH